MIVKKITYKGLLPIVETVEFKDIDDIRTTCDAAFHLDDDITEFEETHRENGDIVLTLRRKKSIMVRFVIKKARG